MWPSNWFSPKALRLPCSTCHFVVEQALTVVCSMHADMDSSMDVIHICSLNCLKRALEELKKQVMWP